MNEAKWLAATELYPLANYLRKHHYQNRPKAYERKLRLFGCACCRCVWPLFAGELKCAEVVQAAERFADGEVTADLLATLDKSLPSVQTHGLAWPHFAVNAAILVASRATFIGTLGAARHITHWTRDAESSSGVPVITEEQQTALLRDIFGNPFRPVAFSPSWRTDTAVSLARGMYDSRDFSATPILADALQDAGCDNADILNHCRDVTQPHYRGCWVVDLVLGKD